MEEREKEVLLALQIALLGAVSPALRAIEVTYEEKNIHFNAYFDGEISEEDKESMSCVETEVMSLFPLDHKITYSIKRLDYPSPIPKIHPRAYHRREEY